MGIFPMAESANSSDIGWYDPPWRGQLSIKNLHIPKKLKKFLRRVIGGEIFEVTFDRDFDAVITACGQTRDETWINDDIRNVFCQLHQAGFAHSVEVWDKNNPNGEPVGGIYGLALGGAFFGESMFSTQTNASKVALVYLIAHLWQQGFTVFDTQFVNAHLKQFGCYEMSRADYHQALKEALQKDVTFYSPDASVSSAGVSVGASSAMKSSSSAFVAAFLHSMTQTS